MGGKEDQLKNFDNTNEMVATEEKPDDKLQNKSTENNGEVVESAEEIINEDPGNYDDESGSEEETDADLAIIDMGPPIQVSPSDLLKIAETFKEAVKPSKLALTNLTNETELDRKDANWCFIKLRHKFPTAKGKPVDSEAVNLFIAKHIKSRKGKLTL